MTDRPFEARVVDASRSRSIRHAAPPHPSRRGWSRASAWSPEHASTIVARTRSLGKWRRRICRTCGSRSPTSGCDRARLLDHHHRRRRVPRLHCGHRGRVHRPLASEGRRRDRGAGRAVHPRAGQLLPPRSARAARRPPRRDHTGRHRHVLLRELGCRDHRSRGEAREANDRTPARHRVLRQLPRSHASDDGDDDVEDRLPRRVRAAPGRASSSRRSPIPSPRTPRREIDRALAGLRPSARWRRPHRPRPRPSSSSRCSAKAATSPHRRASCRSSRRGVASTASCSSPTRCRSGFGRTGEMFAVTHAGIEPDVLCMAKGIASGFPFSALGARAEIMARWPKGSHGGTYGGNPIGCAAALGVDRRDHCTGLPRQRHGARRTVDGRARRACGVRCAHRAGARARADDRDRVHRRHDRRRGAPPLPRGRALWC